MNVENINFIHTQIGGAFLHSYFVLGTVFIELFVVCLYLRQTKDLLLRVHRVCLQLDQYKNNDNQQKQRNNMDS